MRTTMLFLAVGAAALGACKWTEFDDLQNEAWVGSTEKPNVKSSDYGVAIQRGATLANGGTAGRDRRQPGDYSELAYDAKGRLQADREHAGAQLAVTDWHARRPADPACRSDDRRHRADRQPAAAPRSSC